MATSKPPNGLTASKTNETSPPSALLQYTENLLGGGGQEARCAASHQPAHQRPEPPRHRIEARIDETTSTPPDGDDDLSSQRVRPAHRQARGQRPTAVQLVRLLGRPVLYGPRVHCEHMDAGSRELVTQRLGEGREP